MNHQSLIQGEKAAKAGIINLLVLGLIKLSAGLITGMTVILADAISTFADILGVFASYMGLKLSRKSEDEHFEYGYYKVETFAALIISLGIIYLAYFIFRQGLETFKSAETGQFRAFALATTVLAIFHSYRLGKKLMIAGKKANSLSLIASAKDKKMDMIAGFAVLISIGANYQSIPYVEGVVSMVISLFILKVGLSSAKESLFFLLDYWNDPILSRKIKAVFRKEKGLVQKLKKLRLRRAGTFIFGQAYVDINPFAGFQDLRSELEILQNKIKKLNPYIKDFAIYSHIPKSDKIRVAIPIRDGKTLNAEVATTLADTRAYLFAEIRDNKVKNYYVKELKPSEKKPTQLDTFLKKERVNILIDNRLNSLIYYNLRRTHHVLIYPHFSDIKKAKQILDLLLIDT